MVEEEVCRVSKTGRGQCCLRDKQRVENKSTGNGWGGGGTRVGRPRGTASRRNVFTTTGGVGGRGRVEVKVRVRRVGNRVNGGIRLLRIQL